MASITTTLTKPSAPPRWLHRWAVLTVCATVVLLGLGAVVTTFKVGMADPIWPTYPWHLLRISWREPSPGYLIEHTHRLAGYTVGCCTIVLAVGLAYAEPRRWVRRLGFLALLGVIVQGLLGGFRVRLNALLGPNLALIHGSFAQLVFALLVGLALFTSASWSAAPTSRTPEDAARLRRIALVVAGLIYLQLVLGGFVRHTNSSLGQRGHLLVAFAVVAAATWLVKTTYDHPAADRSLSRAVSLLAALVAVQLMLGVEAWILKYAAGPLPDLKPISVPQGVVRTAHFLVGSAVFATAVVVALRAARSAAPAVQIVPAAVQPTEDAA